MRAEEKERQALLKDLMGRAEKKARDAYGQYIALGLADWACEHTSHPGAEAVLDLVLAGRSGAIRKGAVDLADAMNLTDLLEKLARSDPDKEIRNRALKRLGKSPGQGNLFGRAGTSG